MGIYSCLLRTLLGNFIEILCEFWGEVFSWRLRFGDSKKMKLLLLKLTSGALFLLLSCASLAKIEVYQIDPDHTYPSFEADHLGGLSKWRGKINATEGMVTVDNDNFTGTVEIKMDMNSLDFGHEKMNQRARKKDLFYVEKFPYAFYSGTLLFEDEAPKGITGVLTLRGVSKSLDISIEESKCIFHPIRLKRACGADAYASFRRDDYGIDYGKILGFKMDVDLRISIEGFRTRN